MNVGSAAVLNVEDLLTAAAVASPDEWLDFLSTELIAQTPTIELKRAVMEAFRSGILGGQLHEVSEIELVIARVSELAATVLRLGPRFPSIGHARAAGFLVEIDHYGDTTDNFGYDILTAFSELFHNWFDRLEFHGEKIPTAILYGLLPGLFSAIHPKLRGAIVGPIFSRMAARTRNREAAGAIDACLQDYEIPWVRGAGE